ncbi:hypothetical protein AB6A40_002068 [Gnathostoma spinigerum]|uniref:Uncharacterized protein n=1 Tax=Gnathostoma spinigerum TaxID=75299 RepID=A0ABD6E5P4_9BILA
MIYSTSLLLPSSYWIFWTTFNTPTIKKYQMMSTVQSCC